ncbi:MAG: NADH-quinone oxidoreductase subunit NuoE [Nitrospiraceae bacterium]|nr:NADH-quinone oxidoreductase subunit NuoE [Nitrospiraceae bacterium]
MLTDEEKSEIAEELAQAERREQACVEALLAVQKRRGWVSDENLAEIALLLGMTPAELDAVATFYSFVFRKPVGRHVITLCDSMVCWSLGLNPLYEHLKARMGITYGETTKDNRFTLLPASCMGACDRAPVMMIDNDLYGPVEPGAIEGILRKYT